jgi:hypothetical protein
MRLHRRGKHVPKAQALSVDQVMCKVLPRGHLNVAKTHLCFHNMIINLPPTPLDCAPVAIGTIKRA